jgi:hypothetical protein
MVRMFCAMDTEGITTDALSAIRHRTYRCVCCLDRVTLKRGSQKAAHFAHRPCSTNVDTYCALIDKHLPEHIETNENEVSRDRNTNIHKAAMSYVVRVLKAWINGEGKAPEFPCFCFICNTSEQCTYQGNIPIGSALVAEEVSVSNGKFRVDIAILSATGIPLFAVEIVNTHKSSPERALQLLSIMPVAEVDARALLRHGEWKLLYPLFSNPSHHPMPWFCPTHVGMETIWNETQDSFDSLFKQHNPNFYASRAFALPRTLVLTSAMECDRCGSISPLVSFRIPLFDCGDNDNGPWDYALYTNGIRSLDGNFRDSCYPSSTGNRLVPDMYNAVVNDSVIPFRESKSGKLFYHCCCHCMCPLKTWSGADVQFLNRSFDLASGLQYLHTLMTKESSLRGGSGSKRRFSVCFPDQLCADT